MPRPLHTDTIKLTRATRTTLHEAIMSTTTNGCQLLDTRYMGVLMVERYGVEGKQRVAATRVAWALAHPESCLTEVEVTRHTCQHAGPIRPHKVGDPEGDWTQHPVCVNADHLVKTNQGDTRKGKR